MPRDLDLDVARRQWAASAQAHLNAIVGAVEGLRKAFEASGGTRAEEVDRLASEVVRACGDVTNWLGGAHAPRGLAKAGGELGAVAGVYRNAAVAFRSLVEADPEQIQARVSACETMLAQGDHHVEVFAQTLINKLGADWS